LGIAAWSEASLEGECHEHDGWNQRVVLRQPIGFEDAPDNQAKRKLGLAQEVSNK